MTEGPGTVVSSSARLPRRWDPPHAPANAWHQAWHKVVLRKRETRSFLISTSDVSFPLLGTLCDGGSL